MTCSRAFKSPRPHLFLKIQNIIMAIGRKGGFIGFIIGLVLWFLLIGGFVTNFINLGKYWWVGALFVGILFWKIIPI